MTDRLLLAFALPLLLAACASAGPLEVRCDDFASYSTSVETGPGAENPFFAPMMEMAQATAASGGETPPPYPVLLLSGGGQWGAFGAGFLKGLADRGQLPAFKIVTGVSTGAMQAPFAALANEPKDPAGRADQDLVELATLYQPASEDTFARRFGDAGFIFQGADASLAPLGDEIRNALCPGDDIGADACRLNRLAKGGAPAFVGFVEARSGALFTADLKQIAAGGGAPARECVTAAMLASAAVPVQFQQFRTGGRAWYDGGVRRAVFEATISDMMAKARKEVVDEMACTARRADNPAAECDGVKDAHWRRAEATAPQTVFYVIRNGKSTIAEDVKIDGEAGALPNAKRAVEVILNQNELDSLRAVRLNNPGAQIFYQTADDTTLAPAPGSIFDPAFMRALVAFGETKAADGWLVFP